MPRIYMIFVGGHLCAAYDSQLLIIIYKKNCELRGRVKYENIRIICERGWRKGRCVCGRGGDREEEYNIVANEVKLER